MKYFLLKFTIKKISMKGIIISILSFISFNMLYAQATSIGTLVHDGVTREYRLRLPANHNKNIPIPLVFNFHGFGSNANQQEFYSFMNSVADTARFAVCYPEGIQNAWNVGWDFGSTADDVGFTSKLIDELIDKYGFDKNRVYACGMSNGGFFSYQLACKLNNKIAAVASVTGSMVPAAISDCKPGKPVPVLEIHGTADATVDYNGSAIAASIPSVMAFWQKNNGCDDTPVKVLVPNSVTTDNTTTEKYTYVNCNQQKEVIHYKVLGGGHTWPGSIIEIGTTSKDFSASAVIWDFFKKYKLDTTTSINALNDDTAGSIFPNPFDEQIVIRNPGDEARLVIYNTQGKIVLSQTLDAAYNEVNAVMLPPGLYLGFIESATGKSFIKLSKL